MFNQDTETEINPLKKLLLAILIIFIWEVLSFLFLISLHSFVHEPLIDFIDGVLDTIFIAPLIYIILIRPLIGQIKQSKSAEDFLQTNLEDRVKERTLALSISNELLYKEIATEEKIKETLESERNDLEKRIEERTSELSAEVNRYVKVESQLRLQTTALESAGNGVFITNRQGIIEWANQAFYAMSGYQPEELLGKTPRLIKSGLYDDNFYSQFWKTIQAGNVWRGEIANRRKDGTLYIEEQTVAPVIDVNNQVTHFIAIKQDITERKRAEEVIRADATRAEIRAGIEEALSEAGPDIKKIYEVTVQKMAELIGDICFIHQIDPVDQKISLVGFDSSKIGRGENDPLELIQTAGTIGSELAEKAIRTEQVLLMSNGSTTNLLVFDLFGKIKDQLDVYSGLILPMFNHGIPIGTLSILRRTTSFPFTSTDETIIEDLCGRVALAISHARLYHDLENSLSKEQAIRDHLVQTEKYVAMGRMVASVTHELNNPLQTIKNSLYLLESDLKPDVSHEFLNLASSEVQRLTDLVDQLREVYRPHNNTQRSPCDLVKLLEDVEQLIFPHLKRNLVKWELAPIGHPLLVVGLLDQLKQVFINISLNAIEAMPPVGGIIRISFLESNDGKQAGVDIYDNGPGIPEEHLSDIFEPLYTTKEKGLGLGLSISYDIVHKHGGHITVESLSGQGTHFTVWLPKIRDDLDKTELVAN